MSFSKNCIVYLFALCFFLVGCGQDQERPTESLTNEKKSITDHGSTVMEGVKDKASEIKKSVEKHVDNMAVKGSELLEKAKTEGGKIKEKSGSITGEQVDKAKSLFKDEEAETHKATEGETPSIVQKLIEKAKELFGQGKYKESIEEAQKILIHHDSESQEAKDIISKAKEKLSELVPAEAEAKVEDLKENVTNKFKGLGQ